MKKIPLTQGKFALVDDADFDWLNQWKWCAHKTKNTWYACRNAPRGPGLPGRRGQLILMHRLLLPGAQLKDHRDGDGLNNQRHNLRQATYRQNGGNANLSKRNKSGFRGVYFSRDHNAWTSQVNRQHLGYFSTVEEAARAYDKAAVELFGEFARLNFPEKQQTQTTN